MQDDGATRFFLYDAPKVSPGRPRANGQTVRIYKSQYIYIGRELVKQNNLNETGRVMVGISEDKESLLVFPVPMGDAVDKKGLKLTHDTESDRYKVYIGGFAREFGLSEEFYNTTDHLRVSVTEYEGKKALVIKKPLFLLSERKRAGRAST